MTLPCDCSSQTGRPRFAREIAFVPCEGPVRVPLVLRLAGCWVIWAVWCSTSGWLLSLAGFLKGYGYAALTPLLAVGIYAWLRHTLHPAPTFTQPLKGKLKRFFRNPLAGIYFLVVVGSVIGGMLYVPWSSDAAAYRFPRMLYWWSAGHWYWLGHVDHRLDFSSCGFEWQLLPILLLTKSDRFFFLLNWLPYLLAPGLIFLAFRALGVAGRSARRWMYLLPLGYCFALQAGSVQNDGYSINYLLVAIVLFAVALRLGSTFCAGLGLLAMSLLTGAKLSNLPLMLPLGLIALPVLLRLRFRIATYFALSALLLGCSFAPLAFLSWKSTGDWAGDPNNQWAIRSPSKLGCLAVNVILQANQLLEIPICPVSRQVKQVIHRAMEQGGGLTQWLVKSNSGLTSIGPGDMVYEGSAGIGAGLTWYVVCLLIGGLVARKRDRVSAKPWNGPWVWKWAPATAWISMAVYMMMMATSHTPRVAAPYYPMLLISLLLLPRIAQFERTSSANYLAVFAGLTVMPLIVLTPIRPLVPLQCFTLLKETFASKGFLAEVESKYRAWAHLRDDLAPLRASLPPGVKQFGFAGGFLDTCYGLWKPFGTREFHELGLPMGSYKEPPAGLAYAVVTERGLRQRYEMDLDEWLKKNNGKIEFQFTRRAQFEASDVLVEPWYLVRLHENAR